MAVRKKPRIKMVAPIRIWGMDSAGKPFNVLAYTLNVSGNGARIGGVKVALAVGDAVTLQYKQNRALFKVVWLGRPGDPTQEQIGVTLLEQDRPIWGDIEDPADFKDDFQGRRKERPVEAPTATQEPTPAAANGTITAGGEPALIVPDVLPAVADEGPTVDTNGLLRASAEGLLKIDVYVKKNPPGPETLHEFRDALAKVRATVWALQQWHETKAEGKNAFPLMSYLNAERAHFMVQAAKDLADDIEQKGVEVDGAVLATLFERVERLRLLRGTEFALEVIPPQGNSGVISQLQVGLRGAMTDTLRSGMSEADSMRYIARELQREVRADGVALARSEHGEMVCVGSCGNAPEVGMILETDTGIGGEAVAKRDLIYCGDTQADARVDAELCRTANIGAVAMVPVLSAKQETVGMVQISTARSNPFTDEHLTALRSAAGLLRDVLAGKKAATPAQDQRQ